MPDNKGYYPSKRSYSTVFSLFLHIFWMIFLLSFLSLILLLSWFGILMLKNESNSSNKAQQIINQELNFVSRFYPADSKVLLKKMKKSEILVLNGMNITLTLLKKSLTKVHRNIPGLNQFIQWTLLFVKIIEIIVLRLCIFVLSIPLILSILFIAVVDGLGQRDIRKFQGARESTFFFHRIKPIGGKIFYLLLILYLCLPWYCDPLTLLFPMMLLLSITIMQTIKSYKKYL